MHADSGLQRYRERAEAGEHRANVTAGSIGKKEWGGRDWTSSRSRRDPDGSSQESIIGMSPDHVDFINQDKSGVFVTRTVIVR